jgi:hypothetical protein
MTSGVRQADYSALSCDHGVCENGILCTGIPLDVINLSSRKRQLHLSSQHAAK